MPIPYRNQTAAQKRKYAAKAKIWRANNKDKVDAARKKHNDKNKERYNSYNKAKKKLPTDQKPAVRTVFDFETNTTKKVYE